MIFELVLLYTFIPSSRLLEANFDPKTPHLEYLKSELPVITLLEDLSLDGRDGLPSNENWILENTTFSTTNRSVVLVPNVPFRKGSVSSKEFINPAIPNWRLEVAFSATNPSESGNQVEGSPGFAVMIADRASINAPLRKDNLTEFHGLMVYIPIWFNDHRITAAYAAVAEKNFLASVNNLIQESPADETCQSLKDFQINSGVIILLQYVNNQLTLAVASKNTENDALYSSSICFENKRLEGFASLIDQQTLAIGAIGYTQGYIAEIQLHSLSFFSVAPRTTTTTSTTTTRKPQETYTLPNWAPNKVPKVDLPTEKPIPTFSALELRELCLDFAPNISAPPNKGKPTEVHASFIVDNFLGIDDVDESISVSATLFLQWKVDTCPGKVVAPDLQVSERVFVASVFDVWRPVVIFRSSPDDVYMKSDQYGDDLVVAIRPTDPRTINFYWTRIGIFKSRCALDLVRFPFDRQTCNFSFSLQRTSVLAQFAALEIEQPPAISDMGEWKLEPIVNPVRGFIESTAMKSLVSSATFFMSFQRRPDYFAFNLLAPTLVLILMELGAFLLPPNIPERSTFAVTILLALTVAQSDVLKMVPKSSQRILLSDYILLLQLFSGGCTLYDMMICCYCHLPVVGRRRIGLCCMGRNVSISVARFCDIIAITLAAAALGIINFYAANVILNLN